MRRHRVWIIAAVMWSLGFAQAATAAHACSMLAAAASPQAQTVEQGALPMHSGCAGMANQSHSTVNVCAAHCVGNDQSSANADVPSAGVAPQPALTVHLSPVRVAAYFSVSSLVAPIAAPPLHLRFVRFLI